MHRRSSIDRTGTRLARALAALAAGALAAAMLVAAPTAVLATAPPLPAPERIAGADRYETAARISQQAFPNGADVAYLVTGEGFADGLSAGPAAAHEGGPVLLSRWGQLPPATVAELGRLDPDTVVIVGGERSLAMSLDVELRALHPGMSVVRLAGIDRFDTSRMVAERAFATATSVFIATGLRFPDALAAGPAAAARSGPVLLVDGGSGSLDPGLEGTLILLRARWVGVVGGEDAVSAGIVEDLEVERDVRRFAGSDRFGTAAALMDVLPVLDSVYVASGEGSADALAGAAAAGAEGAAMLLGRRDCMPDQTVDALAFRQPDRVILLGSEATLGPATAAYARCG